MTRMDDHDIGIDYDSSKHPDADNIYVDSVGSRNEFKSGFKTGFELGYRDGYTGKDPQVAEAPPLPAPRMAQVEQTPMIEELPPEELARADVPPISNSFKTGWDQGYASGYEDGKADYAAGVKFDADDAPNSEGYRTSYQSSFGKRSEFKRGFKDGFDVGYEHGYSGVTSMLLSASRRLQLSFRRRNRRW